MNVKIDTKEKFRVIRLDESELSVNMTDSFEQLLTNSRQETVKNVILDMAQVQQICPELATKLAKIQGTFYENGHSFVICSLQSGVENQLDEWGLLEVLNTTPTESEAWDIVQMEEMEREFLSEGEDSSPID